MAHVLHDLYLLASGHTSVVHRISYAEFFVFVTIGTHAGIYYRIDTVRHLGRGRACTG